MRAVVGALIACLLLAVSFTSPRAASALALEQVIRASIP